jgi:RNA methyltransferase, TrmH family
VAKDVNIMPKEISSLQHPLVKHLVRLRQNRDYREEHQSVMVEGTALVREVCQQHPAKLIMTYDETFLPAGVKAEEVVLVNEDIMHKVSGVQTPEGIVAEVAMPKPASMKGKRLIMACDGVSEPGNLGAILRTTLALGWDGAFLLNNSCDPFNDKALRSAKGATFRLPIAMGTWKDLQKIIKENRLEPLVADVAGTPLGSIRVKDGVLLVLGNEAHGPSEESRQICQAVKIPMPGEMESLNVAVAGGILMYVLKGLT